MNKQSALQEIYQSAFSDEMEKVALVGPLAFAKKNKGNYLLKLLNPKTRAATKRFDKVIDAGVDSAEEFNHVYHKIGKHKEGNVYGDLMKKRIDAANLFRQ